VTLPRKPAAAAPIPLLERDKIRLAQIAKIARALFTGAEDVRGTADAVRVRAAEGDGQGTIDAFEAAMSAAGKAGDAIGAALRDWPARGRSAARVEPLLDLSGEPIDTRACARCGAYSRADLMTGNVCAECRG
jgi:hypothetical protein